LSLSKDAFAAAQRGDALLAPQPLDHDPDLRLGGEASTRLAPDVSDRLLGCFLLGHGFPLLSEPGTLAWITGPICPNSADGLHAKGWRPIDAREFRVF
jgi:hypothetical protein